ncbi:MAG: hypothetical protein ASUL_08284 [Candidatus Aramenus sulfurataquae]|uniref:Uncharacterized protein n=1 Tax=Candidatus Aramenus sulfurataquae TaxID=1326980 RepID=W7KU02_9CREN|nr:MAG: hypothetical protein ASUL_08284 [Candidatus Aramenus sulfurataquae]
MCIIRTAEVSRPVLFRDVLLINEKDFEKLSDENYFRVLAMDKKWEEISKSYFYYIVGKLRELGLLLDNAISFKVVLPFTVNEGGFHVSDGLLYLTEDRKLVYYNPKFDVYACSGCPVVETCLKSIKSLARETGIKLRNECLDRAWSSVLEEVRRVVVSRITFMRARIDLTAENKVRELEWAKQGL